MTEYTAATTDATNSITATPEDTDATVSLFLADQPVTSPVRWAAGKNVLKVVVANGESRKTYTVEVTKS